MISWPEAISDLKSVTKGKCHFYCSLCSKQFHPSQCRGSLPVCSNCPVFIDRSTLRVTERLHIVNQGRVQRVKKRGQMINANYKLGSVEKKNVSSRNNYQNQVTGWRHNSNCRKSLFDHKRFESLLNLSG